MKIKVIPAVLFLLIIGLPSFLCADDDKKIVIEKFAHETEKIKPNPKAEFETLKNGFRYILLPNKTPEKRVMVNLYVGVGSLNETDKQQGLAHFLEHMAFNGTKNYPGESLVDFFKKMGMNFGGDTNAHTNFNETVYKLNLPEEKYMNDAISIIADYAMNMTLSQSEIDKERGIILSEKRSRDSIDYRIFYQSFQFELPGNLISKRFPIGLEETINSVNRDDFLDFYNTWYRPENMVLIVVGDINTKEWSKSISKAFKSFKAKALNREKPELTDVGHKGIKINYIHEKEAAETSVEIGTVVVKKSTDIKYKEKRKIQIAEAAATHILNDRIREKLTQKDTPFTSGGIRVSNWMNNIQGGSIYVSCKPENWKACLTFIENDLRKVLQYGFTDQELALFKKEYLSQLDNAVNTMTTRNSNSYMSQILSSLADNIPFLDAVQTRDLEKPMVEELTKEEALKEFKKYWLVDHRLVSVTGNVEIKNPEQEIKTVLNEASLLEVKEQKEELIIAFPFEKKPEVHGQIVGKDVFKELDFTRITFSNNVVLNMKKTDFKKNEISFNINFGRGALSLPKDKECMIHLAPIAVSEGGLTKLSKNELIKSLTGKNVSAQFIVGANSFQLQGSTTPEDFELNLQLCRAKLLYSGFREEAFEIMKKQIDQVYNNLNTKIDSYFGNSISKKLSGGNKAMYWPERNVIEAISLNDIKEWLTGQFNNTPMEINIVGDIDEKKTIELVSTYFGSLPERQKISLPARKSMELGEKFDVTEDFKTAIKRAYVLMIIPTVDYREIGEVRTLNLLGQILNEKTRKLVREKLSISYSPGAGHRFEKDFKNACYFQFVADVEPQNIDAAKKAFDSIIKETFENGVTSDELEGVRKPIITSITTFLKTNGYWLSRVLSDSTSEPENLTIAQSFLKGYEEITLQQVNDAAKKYLILDKKSAYVLQAKDDAINVKLEPSKEESK